MARNKRTPRREKKKTKANQRIRKEQETPNKDIQRQGLMEQKYNK